MHAHRHMHTRVRAHASIYTPNGIRAENKYTLLFHFQSCHFAIDQNKEKCMGEGSATMVLLLLFEAIHGELDFNLTAELVPLGGHMQGRTLSSHLSSCENL